MPNHAHFIFQTGDGATGGKVDDDGDGTMGDDDNDDDDGDAMGDGAMGYDDGDDGNGRRQRWHDDDGDDNDGNGVTGDRIRCRWQQR